MRNLTNLENIVIAQVWRLVECTAHEVRRSFADSTAGRYSSSAGSIYPILKRLTAARFLSVRDNFRGQQKRTIYKCTSKGQDQIKSWLFRFDIKELFPDDPLRTCLIYLDNLDCDQQLEWFRGAEQMLEEQRLAITDEYRLIEDEDSINSIIFENLSKTMKLRKGLIQRARERHARFGKLELGPAAKEDIGGCRPLAGIRRQKKRD